MEEDETKMKTNGIWMSLACVATMLTLAQAPRATAADLPAAPGIDLTQFDLPDATAGEAPVFVRLGGTQTLFDSKANARIAGQAIPGADARVGDVASVYAEVGVKVGHGIAVSLSGGIPPTITGRGLGALAPDGKLFRATVGVGVLAATYHFDPIMGFSPYVGGGAAYAITFGTEALAIGRPRLQNNVAPAIVAGVDYAIDQNWGVFVDVKRLWLRQTYSGLASPGPGIPAIVPVRGTLRTDPLMVSAGISYRF